MSAPQIKTDVPGPRSRELAKRLAAVESPAFEARREARKEASGEDFAPIVYASASGDNVTDVDGNVFVDLTAGFGAMLLGHRPLPATDLVLALGDVYASEVKVRACEELAKLFPEKGARVMLGDEVLGEASGPVRLPYGTSPLTLTVSAPGYEPLALEVVPEDDRESEVKLKRRTTRPKPVGAVPSDLESPF